jgi:hypothetical protein
MGQNNCFLRKLVWVIAFGATFLLKLLINVSVGSLHEDLGEDLGSWTHGDSTLTRKLVWPTLITFMLILHSC